MLGFNFVKLKVLFLNKARASSKNLGESVQNWSREL